MLDSAFPGSFCALTLGFLWLLWTGRSLPPQRAAQPATATATPVVSGLTTANVQLTVTFVAGAPSAMTVAITNFRVLSYFGRVTLNGKPYVWFPYLGTWGPP